MTWTLKNELFLRLPLLEDKPGHYIKGGALKFLPWTNILWINARLEFKYIYRNIILIKRHIDLPGSIKVPTINKCPLDQSPPLFNYIGTILNFDVASCNSIKLKCPKAILWHYTKPALYNLNLFRRRVG